MGDKPDFRVSDHAVLRYMERAMGMNVEIVRQQIALICQGYAAAGASCVRHEGIRFELANNAVITVTPDDNNLSKTTRDRQQAVIKRRRDAFFEDLAVRYADRDRRDGRRQRPGRPIAVVAGQSIGSIAALAAVDRPGRLDPNLGADDPDPVLPGGLPGGPAVDFGGAE